jgi:small subunit ribosomal protein S18
MKSEKKEKNTNIVHIDFKDVLRIKAHMNPHSRMFGRKRTGLKGSEQRDFARAVKRARFMALVPYVSH